MTSFPILLGAWCVAAATSIATLAMYFSYSRRAGRLPEACKYNDLAARIATKAAELADVTLRLDEARNLIEHASQSKAEMVAAQEWMARNKDMLLSMEGDRKQQEVLQAQIGTIQEELTTRRAELDRTTSERSVAQANIDALRDQHKTLTTSIETATRQVQEADTALHRMKAEMETAHAHHAALQRSIGEVTEELARTRSALDEARLRSDSLAEQIRSLQQEERTTIAAVEETKRQFASEKTALQDMRQQLQTISDHHAMISQDIKVLTAKRDVAQEAAQAAEKAHALAAGQMERLQAELKKTQEERDKTAGEVSSLRGTRDGLAKEIEALTAIAASLREDLKGLAPGKSEDRYRDLWEPIDLPKLILSNNVREQQALENTRQHLNAVGLRFPNRVVDAFHTALKTADMSPLVVLAGISGTGKSQLPKRYAEGMGIHFASLAVQPRWDSPQDLFGFFNHLEKRYKATELARAMIQFERHCWKQWPECYRRAGEHANEMILVLLDEMNLARVEYYFSEFLSRLEFRRDISDPAKDGKRMQAEIRLDMGALHEGEKEIRLYPDRNILFTGTMNEDESTQTLSDKVLDRACVLRFGRPKKLVTEAAVGQSKEPFRSKHGVSLDQWMSWSSQRLTGASADQVGTWIEVLNDCMDQLHRPFAHRVAQAMQQYVANYPVGQLDERTRIRYAMADQIEQRILPKLRGIEVEEHESTLARIDQLLTEIGDMDLVKSYKSCRTGGPVFMWRGLDRT